MNISVERNLIFTAISKISGVIEKRQTLPILSNVVAKASGNHIAISATDLEIQITTLCPLRKPSDAEFTLPARKFYDICKNLPEGSLIDIQIKNDKAIILSGKSKFILSILPASDYPSIAEKTAIFAFSVKASELANLLSKTLFSMAHQDVRYYLNGMLFELNNTKLKCVATDGHRLAMSEKIINQTVEETIKIILPRKAISELSRIISTGEDIIDIEISEGFVKFRMLDTVFITKIIDGKYPEYQKVIPSNLDLKVVLNKEELRNSLIRTAILSSEKYKGVKMTFANSTLTMQAHNPEQEQAEEIIEIDFSTNPVTIGFNINYILDVINVIESDSMNFIFSENGKSVLLQDINNQDNTYVVMPMRL